MAAGAGSCRVALPGEEIVEVIPPGRLAHLGIATAVPVVGVRRFDERQTRRLVHDYLQGRIEGTAGELEGCRAYCAGICRDTGGTRLPCLFHEPEAAAGWAREWERVVAEDGGRVLQRRCQGGCGSQPWAAAGVAGRKPA